MGVESKVGARGRGQDVVWNTNRGILIVRLVLKVRWPNKQLGRVRNLRVSEGFRIMAFIRHWMVGRSVHGWRRGGRGEGRRGVLQGGLSSSNILVRDGQRGVSR
jgi:hypothetical protein